MNNNNRQFNPNFSRGTGGGGMGGSENFVMGAENYKPPT